MIQMFLNSGLVFYAFAACITLLSLLVVAGKNPVACAIYLVGDLFLLAGVYALLNAHFIAAIQILIYTGAIVVLFVFVIMLLDLRSHEVQRTRLHAFEWAFLLFMFVGFVVMVWQMLGGEAPTGIQGGLTDEVIAEKGGHTYVIGLTLFSRYLWPFELASILILLAVVASVVISKKPDAKKVEGVPS